MNILRRLSTILILLMLSIPFLAHAQIAIVAPGQALPPGNAHKLIVWVHGCCTNETSDKSVTKLLNKLRDTYKDHAFFKSGQWQIVVWDWSRSTPNTLNLLDDARAAYNNAIREGNTLATTILGNPTKYDHIHFIGHSAGANMIHEAAKTIAQSLNNTTQPFIHLTFLDAYTPDDAATKTYGCTGPAPSPCLPTNYPYYAEHYVDIGLAATDAILPHAFNFDITHWQSTCSFGDLNCHHQWPLEWYTQSILFKPPVVPHKYGHLLSLEGGNQFINVMNKLYPTGKVITLTYPTPLGLPEVTGVAFPSSINGSKVPVRGTVSFKDDTAGTYLAQFDVLGDTCGGCFQGFALRVSHSAVGQFPFDMWCGTDNGYFWTIKLTLKDVREPLPPQPAPVPEQPSSPYTFSVQCKPV